MNYGRPTIIKKYKYTRQATLNHVLSHLTMKSELQRPLVIIINLIFVSLTKSMWKASKYLQIGFTMMEPFCSNFGKSCIHILARINYEMSSLVCPAR